VDQEKGCFEYLTSERLHKYHSACDVICQTFYLSIALLLARVSMLITLFDYFQSSDGTHPALKRMKREIFYFLDKIEVQAFLMILLLLSLFMAESWILGNI